MPVMRSVMPAGNSDLIALNNILAGLELGSVNPIIVIDRVPAVDRHFDRQMLLTVRSAEMMLLDVFGIGTVAGDWREIEMIGARAGSSLALRFHRLHFVPD